MEFMQQDIKLLLFLLFTTKPCFNVKRKCTPNVQSNVVLRQLCEDHYGVCPGILINGHTEASFSYCRAPLEYILQELLKNAMRLVDK